MRKHCLAVGIGLALTVSSGRAQPPEPDSSGTAPTSLDTPAQSGTLDEAATLDAVTVTARRRSESAQSVPIAVSAFDADDLRELQADRLGGLQGAAPNVNIVQGRGSSSSANIFIRGIGQPDALPSFDPGVGIYVDDVYYSRIQGALLDLFDVEQIEVLRGPQGTLYGKNSTGGAIRIDTREPGDEATGVVEASVGNRSRAEVRAYGAAPLSDTVSASVAALWGDNDGYVRDSAGHHYNDDGTGAARVKLSLRPSERFSATLSLDYTRQDNAMALGNPEAPLVRTELTNGARTVLLVPSPGDYDFVTDTSIPADDGQTLTHQGASAALTFGLGPAWSLKSISAYRDLEARSHIDIDASPFRLGDTFATLDQHQLSQEFQFQYDGGGPVDGVFGLYYLEEDFSGGQDVVSDDVLTFLGFPVSYLTVSRDQQQTRSSAVFGQFNWDFATSWTLTAGLRYTHESKDYARDNAAIVSLPPLNSRFAFARDQSWSAWTPSLSLSKSFSDRVMAYASANRGFKSGGFNGRASRDAETTAFDPEYVWTYETGLKAQSDSGRLRGNFAAFHSDYRDFQARVADVVDPSAPAPTFVFPVLNAAQVSIDGFEFEGIALLGRGTRLSAQIGWLDARYDRFDDPRASLDPGLHDHVPFSPRWTAHVALTQTFWLPNDSTFTLGGDAAYRDETWLSVDNREALRQPAYTVFGLFGTWDSPDYRWQLRAGARNLGDEVYKTDAQEFSSVANVQTAYYGWPRNYYASVRYSF